MANVEMTLLTNGLDNGTSNTYTTASITPSANKLILACFNGSNTGGHVVPTLAGNGLTWVVVQNAQGTPGSNLLDMTVFRTMGSGPTTGTIVATYAGQTQRRCNWAIIEFANVDTGGTNGADAVVQSGKTLATTDVNTVLHTLSAFGDAKNATFGMGYHISPGTTTDGVGFTTVAENVDEFTKTLTQWRNDNDTTVDMTWSSTATEAAMIALEIKFAEPATTQAAGTAGHLGMIF